MLTRLAVLTFALALTATRALAQQATTPVVKNPFNPPAFQSFAVSPSPTISYWLSADGIAQARSSRHPNLRGMLQRFGVDPGAPFSGLRPTGQAAAVLSHPVPLSKELRCGQTDAGFNLQPAAGMPDIGVRAPINNEAIDFIPAGGRKGADLVIAGADDFRGILQPGATVDGSFRPNPLSWGLSGTGYYVARDGGCGASFEGGLPHIADPNGQGDLFGLGEPAITVDTNRGNVFESDIRLSFDTTAVGLFRTTAAHLNSDITCPAGTHLVSNKEQDVTASTCWPFGILVGASDQHTSTVDRPQIRVDERARGVGAGDVYVSWSFFQVAGDFITTISLSACRPDFTSPKDCSAPVTISGTDVNTEFPHVAVRPDGLITITYVNAEQTFSPIFRETDVIRYVVCRPQGAPLTPTCSAPSTIAREDQPVVLSVVSQGFNIFTRPVHAVRLQSGQIGEVVAWTRCKETPFVPFGQGQFDGLGTCPDSDVVFSTSDTDRGGTPIGWSAPRAVNADLGDQFFPVITSDLSTGSVNIQYYSSENDPLHHRVQLMVSTLDPSSERVSAPKVVIKDLNETNADPFLRSNFFGDYTGIASRAGRTYSNSTQNRKIIYDQTEVFGQTNVLTTVNTDRDGKRSER